MHTMSLRMSVSLPVCPAVRPSGWLSLGFGWGLARVLGGTWLWTACGQRCVDSKNSQTTPATTSTSSIRQLLGRR